MIEVKGLSKKYTGSEDYALQGVSFDLQEGELVGLIGKNGAGKSTLLKLLCKFLKPTEGSIFRDGKDIFSYERYMQDIGILLEPVFYPQLSAYDNLEFYLQIHGCSKSKREIEDTLELVGLIRNKDEKPGQFSFGMKQRLGLAQALLGNSKVLFLDEPFVGLDPTGISELIGILHKQVKDHGIQAIVSSHQLYELSAICERTLVIQNGKLRFDGIPDMNPKTTLILNKDFNGQLPDDFAAEAEKNQITTIHDGQKLSQLMRVILQNYDIVGIKTRKSVFEEFFEE